MTSAQPPAPPRWVRVVGHTISRIVARFPWTWPLLRGPVRRFFDRLAPEWGKRAGTPGRLAPLDAALERMAEPPRRILDLGTGAGSAALALAEWYPRAHVVGVDISEPMIEQARANLTGELRDRVEFVVADAAALPFQDGEFDLVVQVAVPVFLDETARVLASGGLALVVSSLGAATPFHTPHGRLRSGFRSRGFEEAGSGGAGQGTFFAARKRHAEDV